MKNNKRLLFLTIMFFLGISSCIAENKYSSTNDQDDNDAIFLYVEGSTVCYKFEDRPQLRVNGDSVEVLVNDNPTPVITFDSASFQQIKIVPGIYREIATSIDSATQHSPIKRDGKYISGGRVIIVKDGNVYDASGREMR